MTKEGSKSAFMLKNLQIIGLFFISIYTKKSKVNRFIFSNYFIKSMSSTF